MFDGKAESVKIGVSGIAAALVNTLGGNHRYLALLCVLMVCDTALGWLKAKKMGKWESKLARWGAAGKIVELMLIAVLGMLDWVFQANFLMAAGIFYYGIVEISSMLENIHAGGLTTLPVGLVEVIHKLKFSAGTIMVNKIKEMVCHMIGVNVDTIEDKESSEEKE